MRTRLSPRGQGAWVLLLALNSLLFLARDALQSAKLRPRHELSPHWGSPHAQTHNCTGYLPSSRDNEPLVIVIGGNKPVYSALRGFWRLIRRQVAPSVHIYLVGLSPSLKEPKASANGLIFPGVDSLIPGVLAQTLRHCIMSTITNCLDIQPGMYCGQTCHPFGHSQGCLDGSRASRSSGLWQPWWGTTMHKSIPLELEWC